MGDKPKGSYEWLAAVQSRQVNTILYIAGAMVGTSWRGKRVIVVAHDVFGLATGRHRQFCDNLAEQLDSVVVMPDFYRCNPEDALEKLPRDSQSSCAGGCAFSQNFPWATDCERLL